MDKKITSTIFLFAVTLLAGCDHSKSDIREALNLYRNDNQLGLSEFIDKKEHSWNSTTNCNAAQINNFLAGQAINGLKTFIEFKNGGASNDQLAAIARVELGDDIDRIINVHRIESCNSNTTLTQIEIKVLLRNIIGDLGNIYEVTASKFHDDYIAYAANDRAQSTEIFCNDLKFEASKPQEERLAYIPDSSLYGCDTNHVAHKVSKEFKMPKSLRR